MDIFILRINAKSLYFSYSPRLCLQFNNRLRISNVIDIHNTRVPSSGYASVTAIMSFILCSTKEHQKLTWNPSSVSPSRPSGSASLSSSSSSSPSLSSSRDYYYYYHYNYSTYSESITLSSWVELQSWAPELSSWVELQSWAPGLSSWVELLDWAPGLSSWVELLSWAPGHFYETPNKIQRSWSVFKFEYLWSNVKLKYMIWSKQKK